MDAEQLYNLLVTVINDTGVSIPADADDYLVLACNQIILENDTDFDNPL
jgi:hypothetical protein